jgi:cytochrome c-type biogenesis protein CcmH
MSRIRQLRSTTRPLQVLTLAWLGGFCALALAIDDHAPFEDPALQARFERLTEELRCVKCQNNNIADSNADIARDLRRQVHEMLEAGRTDKEILDFMVERYGDFVLYRPAFKPSNYLLWLAPALMMGGGLWVLVSVIRSRAALLEDEDSGPMDDVAAADGTPGGTST